MNNREVNLEQISIFILNHIHENGLEADLRTEAKDFFNTYNTDGDGELNKSEFFDFLPALL